ncbi:sugar phosphate nucleotidyltransferase [Cytophaga hutchinsonii]|jgi:bifunctional N-acetylglucosamine-1-phosphate-uridyltransferase/glucosamine-1-phosphate-acetyltransferase GlmU-like protein|uniref:UDP-N-acetylglucosamine pyrophosphorylase n=1 Tax=Cytophaga hutchinsonii (strain ATCC 33406 / DSM 1761 / CIP 103989 / NBRC 15051 / NCIMB 9469 / D465) TaxID=269798 RepID=A0A6N4SNU5_CYTH3|nr:NTP transferase domain-containing protein [Cytophaga hutchinsonii]ABG57945.1 UDP-N-acetylglucosamine pyrophosphorylase [Cytophaga hutchinsonii ATCC 33406]SFX09683.1 UDP-N-acetylglucosamine pyrophosphorylase [Cytophaga hutchinsonii ATCC 33406]
MSIALILAAGKGTRMRSDLPKPLVPFRGKPIVTHIIEAFTEARITTIALIIGFEAEKVKAAIGPGVDYILQKDQKGTGHAVMQAVEYASLANTSVFVFVGDAPLITAETIKKLEAHHLKTQASCTFLTAVFDINLPYARVIKNESGVVIACIEEKNATPEQLKIKELLSSHFIFKGEDLFALIHEIPADKENGEYYLTDIISLFLSNGMKVESLQIDNYQELVGLNTPEDIAWAEQFTESIKQTQV